MKLSSIFTALGLLVATPAYATVTLTYSGTANIDIDGVTQVNANVAWTISFDESGVSDNDVDNNEGDFNDVPITDMRVLVNGTTYIIDIGTTDANLHTESTSQYDLLLLTWVGGSPLMDGRARFYTTTGGLESNGFFGDIDEFDSAQNGASGGNDNTSSHDSSIAFSASRPLITTAGEQLVMNHDFPNGTETMQLAIGEVEPEPQAATFSGLGDLPGGIFFSFAVGVSSDGSTVVGSSISASGEEAFRWTESGGMVGLGDLAGGDFSSRAYSVSANGSTVVGRGTSASGYEPFRWTQSEGMVGLGDLAGGDSFGVAYDVSADGSTVVGRGSPASSQSEAFLWTQSGGMVGLGNLPGGQPHSIAYGVSADGSTVLGGSASAAVPIGEEAFLWTLSGGMVALGDLAGGIFESGARRISTDGSTVVGAGSSASGYEAFRWTQSGGMVGLGDLVGGTFSSWGADISADGSTVVGWGNGTVFNESVGDEAFVWNETNGMQVLKQVLIDQGIDMTGWTLSRAWSVSDDGLTIVGQGTNPSGNLEAWIATLSASSPPPVPSLGPVGMSVLTGLLLGIGLAASRLRSRHGLP